MTTVYDTLDALGLVLPDPPAPLATYSPYQSTGNLVFISGQLPMVGGSLLCSGVVPTHVAPDKARAAARMCGLNLLSILHEATGGNLNRVRQVVRLGVFVASTADFTGQPSIANGASQLMIDVFGEKIGMHARAAVGSVSLPLGAPVEIEGLFEIEP